LRIHYCNNQLTAPGAALIQTGQ